jgi:hypothetical protein
MNQRALKTQLGDAAGHPPSILWTVQGSSRLSGRHMSVDQVKRIVTEKHAAFPGKAGVDEEFEQPTSTLQGPFRSS